jgi:V-type H+-transporting ATPase subunit a
VYPIGLDPAWGVSQNELNYVNSLKMKLSVIVGVVHMVAGVFVKASNTLFFHNFLELIFEFVPQIIFLVGFFGYMDFLIVYKWLKPWKLYDSEAPSIITTLINLPLKMGKTVTLSLTPGQLLRRTADVGVIRQHLPGPNSEHNIGGLCAVHPHHVAPQTHH